MPVFRIGIVLLAEDWVNVCNFGMVMKDRVENVLKQDMRVIAWNPIRTMTQQIDCTFRFCFCPRNR